jgi:DNA-binding NarL/FixJ family response regulator
MPHSGSRTLCFHLSRVRIREQEPTGIANSYPVALILLTSIEAITRNHNTVIHANDDEEPKPMAESRSPRVVIADDHILLAEACKSFLEPEFDVIAIVSTGRELLRAAQQLKPDVIVMDIGMPEMNGLDAAEQLRELQPCCKIVFLTMNMSPDVAAEAFRRGGLGYVVKSSTASELATAIRRALKSQSYLSPLITEDTVEFLLHDTMPASGGKTPTRRQSEILQLLAEGMSMKEVANLLNLKPGTIAFHKYKLMQTLGLKSNADLLRYAIKHHLVS